VLKQNIQLSQAEMPGPRRTASILVGYLVAALFYMPGVYADTVIWENGDQIVQLAKQDDDSAAANDHPKSTTPGEIAAMLATLRLRFADEAPELAPITVFTQTELDNLSSAIATGLDRAAPSQDIIFHVVGTRRVSPGSITKRNRVTAGRVFYRDDKFNIIFGQVQTALRKRNVYGQIDEDFLPRDYGSRKKPTEHELVLLANNAASIKRNDWLVIDSAAAATAASQPDTKPEPTPASASAAVPVVVAESATSPSSTGASSRADKAMEQAGGTSTGSAGSTAAVEERLEALKRLRDRELISEEAYQAKMKEILQDL